MARGHCSVHVSSAWFGAFPCGLAAPACRTRDLVDSKTRFTQQIAMPGMSGSKRYAQTPNVTPKQAGHQSGTIKTRWHHRATAQCTHQRPSAEACRRSKPACLHPWTARAQHPSKGSFSSEG